MRRALAAAAVLAAVSCRQQAPQAPATTVVEWAQQSPDGRFELRQRREGTGCKVQAVVKSADGDRTLWSTQNCLPTPSGLAFLSSNGEKVLALDLFPSAQAAQTSDWSTLPLLSLWVRGAVVRQYTGAEILGAERSADMRKVLSWVRGDTFDDVHRAARPSADGERISIDLVDGRTLTLGFEGNQLPAAPAAAPARPAAPADEAVAAVPPSPDRPARTELLPAVDRTAIAAQPVAFDEQGLYRWEDDQGGLHFGAGGEYPGPVPQARKAGGCDRGGGSAGAAHRPGDARRLGVRRPGARRCAGARRWGRPARRHGCGGHGARGGPRPAPAAVAIAVHAARSEHLVIRRSPAAARAGGADGPAGPRR